MRRLILALLATLSLALASPAAAQLQDYRKSGTVTPCKYDDRRLDRALDELPPDVEQYAPGYAEQLRKARGAPCSSEGTAGSGGTTTGGNDRVEDVPVPPAVRGSGGAQRVGRPPVPVATPRTKLADVASPTITARPDGPDVPAWAIFLIVAVLVGGSALFFLGAGFSRLRPLGVAAEEARARASDRAIELWEIVRFGR